MSDERRELSLRPENGRGSDQGLERSDVQLRHLAAAIGQISEGILITDADGTIEYVNDALGPQHWNSRGFVLSWNFVRFEMSWDRAKVVPETYPRPMA